jgi:hypothetical protein
MNEMNIVENFLENNSIKVEYLDPPIDEVFIDNFNIEF